MNSAAQELGPKGEAGLAEAGAAAVSVASAGPRRIAVIIPYFQREKGILTRALASVLRQDDLRNVEIIVVDDGSPVPAEGEIAALDTSLRGRIPIRLLKRKNGGPPAARNTALDALSPDIVYVAFLDSDDEWLSHHLGRARRALAAGADFFFANFVYLKGQNGFNEIKHFATEGYPRLLEDEPVIVLGDDFFDQMLCANPVHTSTVAYRRAGAPELRFNERLFTTDDELFWLELARTVRCIGASPEVDVKCGHGVNIFASAGYGTKRGLEVLYDQACLRKYICVDSKLGLDRQQCAPIRSLLRQTHREFIENAIYRLVRMGKIDYREIGRYVALCPEVLAIILPVAARKLTRVLSRW